MKKNYLLLLLCHWCPGITSRYHEDRWHNSTQHQKEGDTDSHVWKAWGIMGPLGVKWSGTKYRGRRCQDKSGCTGCWRAEMKQQTKSDSQVTQNQQKYKKRNVLLCLSKEGVVSIRNTSRHITEHSLGRWEAAQLKRTPVTAFSLECWQQAHLNHTRFCYTEVHLGKKAVVRKPALH